MAPEKPVTVMIIVEPNMLLVKLQSHHQKKKKKKKKKKKSDWEEVITLKTPYNVANMQAAKTR